MWTMDRTGDTLHAFIDNFRIPDTLIADLTREQSRENTEGTPQSESLSITCNRHSQIILEELHVTKWYNSHQKWMRIDGDMVVSW